MLRTTFRSLSSFNYRLWAAGALVSVLLGVYALVRGVAGFRSRRIEDALFLELTALRRTLHLDNPSVLLPR